MREREREMDTHEEDEPVTPAGRLFLQPQMQTVINCAVGFRFPIEIQALKVEIQKSFLKQPRFCSLLVRDKNGIERWRRTQVEIEKHIIIVPDEEGGGDNYVNDYIADLCVSSPLNLEKPLWEIHVLPTKTCCVLRFHHSLGDGISLMSLFLALCRRVDDPEMLPTMPASKTAKTRARTNPIFSLLNWVLEPLLVVCLTLVYVLDFVLHSLWLRDKKTAISGGAGVELWPRKLATVAFSIDDMKKVKKAVDGTLNDVLLGIISCGLSRYLELRSKPLEGHRITGVAMVNTRQRPGLQDLSSMMEEGSKSRWGNQIGYVLLPVYIKMDAEPLDYVRRAKAMLDRKKRSLEASFSYYGGALVMSLFGPKWATLLNYRIVTNTSFTISNVAGPQEEIMFNGNPVTYLRATTTSIPHAITMHMVSYMGRAELQILVAKDIVPDSKVLAKCFHDALLQMKEAAMVRTSL